MSESEIAERLAAAVNQSTEIVDNLATAFRQSPAGIEEIAQTLAVIRSIPIDEARAEVIASLDTLLGHY